MFNENKENIIIFAKSVLTTSLKLLELRQRSTRSGRMSGFFVSSHIYSK